MDSRNQGIADAIEILTYVDNICKEKHIQYTMLFTTLLSAVETEEVAEWFQCVQIGLVYEEYQRLLTAVGEDKEHEEYYAVTYDADHTFSEQFCRLYKRSHIVLCESRKKDERFYDNFINIFPIYEVAETVSELKRVREKYICYRKHITARATTPGTVRFKNLFKVIRNHQYYIHRDKYTVDGLNQYLKSIHKPGKKYAFIPWTEKQKGCVRLSSTYHDVTAMQFAGRTFSGIRKAKEWLEDCYGNKRIREIRTAKKNVILQQGTETLRRVQLIALDILIEFDRICRKHDIKYILAAGTLLGAVRHKGFIPWDDDIDVFMLYEEWLKFEAIYKEEIDEEKFFVRTQETDADDNLCFFQIKRNDTIYCKEGRLGYNTHRGVFIDILPYYNGANTYLAHKLQERVCKYLKTVTWAHMGAQSEKNFLKRKYYEFLQKHISNKKSASAFFRMADRFKKSQYLCYLYVRRNPYKHGINQRKYFEELTELEFEGHRFFVPKEYAEFLEYSYSKDYMLYPSVNYQINHHFPGHIDLGDLHILP